MARRKSSRPEALARLNEVYAPDTEGFHHMVEDVFVWKAVPGKRSVRAVRDGDDVVLFSTDETALRDIYNALTTEGTTIRGKKIAPPSSDEVGAWIEDEVKRRKLLPPGRH